MRRPLATPSGRLCWKCLSLGGEGLSRAISIKTTLGCGILRIYSFNATNPSSSLQSKFKCKKIIQLAVLSVIFREFNPKFLSRNEKTLYVFVLRNVHITLAKSRNSPTVSLQYNSLLLARNQIMLFCICRLCQKKLKFFTKVSKFFFTTFRRQNCLWDVGGQQKCSFY